MTYLPPYFPLHIFTLPLLFFTSTLSIAVAAVECSDIEFNGEQARVCRVDTRRDRLQLFLNDEQGRPLKSFGKLEKFLNNRGQRLLFAMNAGMYHADYSPVGLLVMNGRQRSPLNLATGRGNFFLKPNGVFVLTAAGAKVMKSSEYSQLAEAAILATQSGPLLLSAGKLHPALLPHGRSRYIRNGVGVITPAQVVFVISKKPVNFHSFALLFRDALHCTDALYLDGRVSSLLSVDGQGRRRAALGPMIAVTADAVSGKPDVSAYHRK